MKRIPFYLACLLALGVSRAAAVADNAVQFTSCPSSVLEGAQISYQLQALVLNQDEAGGLTVTDTFPPNLTVTAASAADHSDHEPEPLCDNVSFCSIGSGIITCGLPDVCMDDDADADDVPTSDDYMNMAITATAPNVIGPITITANAQGTFPDPNPINNTASCTTMVTAPGASAEADVSITKVANPSIVKIGNNVTYTLTVSNAGLQVATNTVVNDNLSSALSWASATTTRGTCNAGNPVACNLGNLAVGAKATVTIVAKTLSVGTVTNTATVSSNAPDFTPVDNTASTTINVVQGGADLYIDKEADSDPVVVGSALAYTLNISNFGPDTAVAPVVTDALPSSVNFVSATVPQNLGSCTGTTTVKCTLKDMPSANNATVIIVVKPTVAGTLSNNAVVASPTTPDPFPGNNSSTVTVTVVGGSGSYLNRIVVTPSMASVPLNGQFQFNATGYDQNNNPMSGISYSWGVANPGNSISQAGLFTGKVPGGDIVTAYSGTISGTATVTVTSGGGGNPAPILTSLTPNATAAGSPQFSMAVNGSNFLSGAVVTWNGVNLATSFGSSSLLTATVPAGDVLNAGSANVQVLNPDGQSSGLLPFTIIQSGGGNPPPVLTSLTPNTTSAGSPSFNMTVNGSGFANGATVTWNGANLATAFMSSNGLMAAVPAADVMSVGSANVQVLNPDTQSSGILLFTITASGGGGGGGCTPAVLSSIAVNPPLAMAGLGGTVSYTAEAFDQCNNLLTGIPFTWSFSVPGNGNTISPTGDGTTATFQAGSLASAAGSYTVTAINGVVSGTAAVTVNGNVQPPGGGLWIIDPASANPNPVTGTTTRLHVLAGSTNSTNGGKDINYQWSPIGRYATITPDPVVLGDANVSFPPQAGTMQYQFEVTIKDPAGLKLTQDVFVMVIQTPARVTVSPSQAITFVGTTFPFTAEVLDQWGDSMDAAVTWRATAGSISQSSGLSASFTSPIPLQNVTVTATAQNGVFGTALMGVQAREIGIINDISNGKAYPVPFKGTSGVPGITFANLAPNTTIKLYATDGHLVDTLYADSNGDNVLWKVTNMNGTKVASGVYLYRIENGATGQVKEGKVVVIE